MSTTSAHIVVRFFAGLLLVAACGRSSVEPSPPTPPVVEKPTFGQLQLIARHGGGHAPEGTTVELYLERLQKRLIEPVPSIGQLDFVALETGVWRVTVVPPAAYFFAPPNQAVRMVEVKEGQFANVSFLMTPSLIK